MLPGKKKKILSVLNNIERLSDEHYLKFYPSFEATFWGSIIYKSVLQMLSALYVQYWGLKLSKPTKCSFGWIGMNVCQYVPNDWLVTCSGYTLLLSHKVNWERLHPAPPPQIGTIAIEDRWRCIDGSSWSENRLGIKSELWGTPQSCTTEHKNINEIANILNHETSVQYCVPNESKPQKMENKRH